MEKEINFYEIDWKIINWFEFYTFWSNLLFILSLIFMIFLKKTYYLNLIYLIIFVMLNIVSVIGFILTYIYPKYFYIKDINLLIEGKQAKILDFIIHQIPLIIYLILFYYNYWNFSKKLLAIAILINIIFLNTYLLYFNPFNIYFKKINISY
jgi:hypothetical protein